MRILSDEALRLIGESWNRRHWIGRGELAASAADPERVLRLVELDDLHWPYLTLVRSSEQPALRDFTLAVPGYRQRAIDAERTKKLVAAGYTLKFQRLEVLDAGFSTPAEAQGLQFHRDASHVVVVQLGGRKIWNIVRPTTVNPDAGLEPEPDGEHIEFVLSPGDVMYLPHGWPHYARTESERSTHLTFTLSPPNLYAVACGVLDAAAGTPDTHEIAAATTARFGL
jgi:hypothetical protein